MTQSLSPARDLELDAPATSRSPSRHFRRWRIGALGAALLIVLFLIGYLPRQARRGALLQEAAALEASVPRVTTITPTPAGAARELLLPGSVEPLETARVHSRASGFVRSWSADIGDEVEAGQVLATLDTPELLRELDQARAALAQADASILQAKATSEHSASSLRRYRALAPEGLVSLQDFAEHKARAAVDAANIQVTRAERGVRSAELARLEELERFATLVAPFAGTVSARHVERGALVTSASSDPLFEIVVVDTVRMFVQVPQSLVADVRPGVAVSVSVNEYPGTAFSGTLTRTSRALDPTSRTMRTEVRVPNPDGRLLPGMYANARLQLERSRRSFLLPATALIVGAEGTGVASVGADGVVRVLRVQVERDLGAEVEIAEGLSGAEHIIRTPGPQIRDGVRVQTPDEAPHER